MRCDRCLYHMMCPTEHYDGPQESCQSFNDRDNYAEGFTPYAEHIEKRSKERPMDELEVMMRSNERIRQLIGLVTEAEAERDRYREALLKIRDTAVNVAAIAEEALGRKGTL